MMRAIKVDPKARTITELEFEFTGDYSTLNAQIYEAGGFNCFDSARLNPEGDRIFLDDMGLYDHKLARFLWRGSLQPFAGTGVILGCTRHGESQDAQISLAEVAECVTWLG